MMKLTDHEKELLRLYKEDKKLRRKKIVAIALVIVLLGCTIYYSYPFFVDVISNQEKVNEVKKDEIKDEKPILLLTKDYIEIYQGDVIDYESYIRKASDSKGGDLKNKVEINKIDTSMAGEFNVIYSLTDSDNNIVYAKLKVIIKEKEIEETSESDDSIQKQEIVQQPQVQQQQPVQQPEIQEPVNNNPPVSVPSTQYFMFSDGYTMDNVSSACASALANSGRSGACTPIQDQNGIYTGMRLDLY